MDILNIFLDNPQQEFHIRQIARLTKQSPTTISKKLKALQKKGLLLSQKKLNHVLYRAHATNPLYQDHKLCHNVLKLRSSGLLEFLENYYNHPSAIILFGSFRKAENTPQSDIDLCIITAKKEQPDLLLFKKKLGHEIQLFLYSQKEFASLRKKNPELLNNFINGMVLSRYLEVFR